MSNFDHCCRNFALALLVAATVSATAAGADIVIDDFDAPDPSSVFPLTDTPLGLTRSGVEVFNSELGTLARFAFLAAGYGLPLPNPLPDGQSVAVSLDATSGILSSTATPDASTLLLLGWVRGSEDEELDLDLSQSTAIQILYSSNLETEGGFTLSNRLPGSDGSASSASSVDVVFPAGTGALNIPLTSITDVVLGTPRLVDGEIVQQPLPPVDLTSVDAVSLSIGRTEATLVPLGLEFTLDRIAVATGNTLSGDYNNNGLVEQQDLDLVLGNWGNLAAEATATWSNDPPEGNIDQTELDKVLGNWGNTGAPGSGAGVPEPTTLPLVAIVLAFLAQSRAVAVIFDR